MRFLVTGDFDSATDIIDAAQTPGRYVEFRSLGDRPIYQRIDTNYTEQVQHVFEFMFEYLNDHGVLVEIGGRDD